MSSQVIGQVGKHKCPFLSLLNSATVDLYVVTVPVDVYLLLGIVNNMRRW